MRTKRALAAIVAVLSAVLGLLVVQSAASAPARAEAAADPVRIMPLGDSITGSPGCWRSILWNRLIEAGHTDIDFVGTLPPQGCGLAHDGDNEGHGGLLVTNVAQQNLLPGWLSATNPDIVMMHFGTNDVWSARSTASILDAYGTLVDQMRANNPDMRILVAQIIPLNPSTCAECAQRAVALNQAIPAWAQGKSTARSPIVVVDQWTGFDTATDTYDGVHPNAAGDAKMADRWFPALSALLDSEPPTDPSPTPTPTEPGGTGCTAAYSVTGQWQGGRQVEIVVRNTSATAISGWTVRLTLAGGEQVGQAWGGTATQNGTEVTIRNAAWNGNLAAGGTASVGMIINGTAAGTPTVACAAA
ncbi:cellulose binding domain-containing protein [Allostreptomyces psammosilenae]|uniref:Lysophospholipase L1-like esterase n=1 Tax=Allostreptomyces psammosilenae TaxID=1892865 RepID=A0A852ZSJ2_9ACTN|nr:cellulose binding domain-containing protein [Allostreptomyces psammosilenae]NYI04467.1 lysophospholipase L1-like esterase [Allostreptomyces psammosilenae]